MITKIINGQPVHIYTATELHGFIDFILCHGRGVTDWEQNFIKDMEGKSQYSPKQAEIIERIYTQRTS